MPPKKRESGPSATRSSDSEQVYYGLHACLSLCKRRRDDILRIYLTKELTGELSEVLRWCARQRRVYRIVPDEELRRISRSAHHEGICIHARPPAAPEPAHLLNKVGRLSKACIFYLDGVQNPHNIGSLLRTGAHFGVACVLGKEGHLPRTSGSLSRIAQGAAEEVPLCAVASPTSALKQLRRSGFSLIAASGSGTTSLYDFRYSPKTVLILGNEAKGISKGLAAMCDQVLRIPGSGLIESLNVAVAAGILCAEFFRQVR